MLDPGPPAFSAVISCVINLCCLSNPCVLLSQLHQSCCLPACLPVCMSACLLAYNPCRLEFELSSLLACRSFNFTCLSREPPALGFNSYGTLTAWTRGSAITPEELQTRTHSPAFVTSSHGTPGFPQHVFSHLHYYYSPCHE